MSEALLDPERVLNNRILGSNWRLSLKGQNSNKFYFGYYHTDCFMESLSKLNTLQWSITYYIIIKSNKTTTIELKFLGHNIPQTEDVAIIVKLRSRTRSVEGQVRVRNRSFDLS